MSAFGQKPLGCLLLFVCACGSDPEAAPNEAKRSGRGAFLSSELPKPTAVAETTAPTLRPKRPKTAVETGAKATADAGKPKERDLPAELLAALGSPTACVKPRTEASAPKEISISADAHVVESGLVTRAYARSSQLDKGELDCIRKQLEALRLQAPIEGAPRAISASLTLTMKAAPAPATADAAQVPAAPATTGY